MKKWQIILIMISICFAMTTSFISCDCEEDESDDDEEKTSNDDDDDDDDNDDDNNDNDTVNPGFVSISSGSFMIGSPETEPGHDDFDETQHAVTLTRNFEISKYETTQGEFESVIGWNPSYFGPNGTGEDCGSYCPVETVSWFDTVAFANALSEDSGFGKCYILSNIVCEDHSEVGEDYMACMNPVQGGIDSAIVALGGVPSVYDCVGYRLPTDAEWEYAARAGTVSAYHNGQESDDSFLNCQTPFYLTEIAWYCGTDTESTGMVGQKLPNAWGLYDMSGHVWEWVWDFHSSFSFADETDPTGPATGVTRTVRGGAYDASARRLRSANRSGSNAGPRTHVLGFRLARTLP